MLLTNRLVLDEVEVATYSIIGEEVVITFNDAVSGLDDVSLNVNIQTQFNTEIFETTEEVVVEVPYSDGTSYTVMVRAEQQEYEGTDLKKAGSGYILDGESKKALIETQSLLIGQFVQTTLWEVSKMQRLLINLEKDYLLLMVVSL